MKRKIFSIFFALMLVLSFSLVTAVPVAAQEGEVWVDDDWGSQADVDLFDDTLTWDTDAFDTIQEGITAVEADGIVNVAAGMYSTATNGESFPIEIDRSLTLKGAQFGTDPTTEGARTDELEESVLDAFDVVGSAIEIGANSVTIDGFTIKNVPAVNVSGDVRYGIKVLPQSDDHSVYSSDIVIANNILTENNRGILVLDNEKSLVKQNLIVRCNPLSSNAGGTGISLSYVRPTTIVTENVLSENTGVGSYYGAILVMYGGYDTQPTITNNQIVDNLGSALGGIVLSGGSAIIRGNTITGNSKGGIWSRIGSPIYWVSGEAPLIIENNLISENGGPGINYMHQLPVLRVKRNTIKDNVGAGIQISATSQLADIAIHSNKIFGNGSGVSTDMPTDATLNWWGSVTGPAHASNPLGTGDAVSDNVGFMPWYTTKTTTLERQYVTVKVGDTEGVRAYSDTIQGGIDAALSDDTVSVAAGTYNEAILIDRQLTLKGANHGVNPVTETRVDESIIDCTGFGTGIDIAADFITIDGFTVRNVLVSSGYAISCQTVDGESDINILNNIIHTSNFGIHSGGPGSNWLISGNEIYDIGHGGGWAAIYLLDNYDRENINIVISDNYIHDNLVAGYSFTIATEWIEEIDVLNNIVVDNADGAYFYEYMDLYAAGNLFDSNRYGVDPWTSLSGAVALIEGNDFTNNERGVWAESSAGTVDVHNNNFVGNTLYGVDNSETIIVDAINNWWDNASGPSGLSYESYGDAVSDNVDYEPWLLAEVNIAEVADGILPPTFDKTLALKDGWTLVSTDKAVAAEAIWVGTNPLVVELAYKYTPTGGFVSEVTTADLEPLTALYVLTKGGGGVGIKYAKVGDPPPPYSKELEAGWNLISTPSSDITANALLAQLRYTTVGTQQWVGLTTLISQENYNQFSGDLSLATLTEDDWDELQLLKLDPFDGYWANMEAADTFEVIPQ